MYSVGTGIWKFNVYVGADVFVILFGLMVEGWLRDSGPIN